MATKEVLTGISYYQYHFFAALTFSGYSVYHYLYGNGYICLSLAAAAVLIAVLIISRLLKQDSSVIESAILVSMISAVYSACYFLGMRGIAWLFPLVIGIFFNYSNRNALIISLLTVLGGLSLASVEVGQTFAIRMFFPLALTIGFAYLYRVTIEKEQNALEKEANEDHLTGIWNRRSFHNWLQRIIPQHKKTEQSLAIFYLDIDSFKQINDTYGHEFGDQILKEFSNRLVSAIRPTDVVSQRGNNYLARIAGDEFVIAAAYLEYEQQADLIAQRLLASVNALFVMDSIELKLTTSIGIALSQGRDISAEDILSEADAAMYRSKEMGKNRITYFDESIAKHILEKQTIARGIEEALRKKDFYLNYMPIFKIEENYTQVLVGAEVLIRCQSDALAGIGPDKYIPIAEEYGMIKDIDLYVVDQAFSTLSDIKEKLPGDFILAINISAKELHNIEFPKQLESLANKYAISRDLIELEITETSLISHDSESIAMLKQLKALGFKLSLDDFGTGYTAFSQLQHYPVDTLKIDRSFVWNISEENQNQQTMVDVILSLAKLYKVKVVAEGVENQTQLDYLVRASCDYFQGFYLSKPLSFVAFNEQFLDASVIA